MFYGQIQRIQFKVIKMNPNRLGCIRYHNGMYTHIGRYTFINIFFELQIFVEVYRNSRHLERLEIFLLGI